MHLCDTHCVKRVRIRSYSGPHFPAYGLKMERNSVSLSFQFECGKMRTRITPDTDAFHAVTNDVISGGRELFWRCIEGVISKMSEFSLRV